MLVTAREMTWGHDQRPKEIQALEQLGARLFAPDRPQDSAGPLIVICRMAAH